MATANQCSKCNKPGAPMHCTGCDKYFCNKDFRGHREGMFVEMDKIIESRNQLQEAINNSIHVNDQQNSVIVEINKWEISTIQKVKEIAAQARKQTIELLNANKTTIQTEFRNFSQKLASLKESEDFVETDLIRLNEMIDQFQLDMNQLARPTAIKLHTEQSDEINWESLIYVEEIKTHNNNQQWRQASIQKTRYVTPPVQVQPECPSHSYITQPWF